MLYQPALAVDRRTTTVGSRRELCARLLAVAAVAFAGVFVVYLLAVRTRWGPGFEDSALAGARQHRGGTWYGDADRWLNRITAESFALSLAVIAAVGLVRRRRLLALCGVLTAAGAVVGARLLKGALPGRPQLGPAGGAAHAASQAPNTLPSGHTAAAMGLFFAALIVVSRRWYVPVTLLALPGAAVSGAATVAAHWHRLSDAVAADLLALAVGLAGLAAVAQLGLVLPTRSRVRSRLGPRLMYIFLVCVATAALAVGAAFTLRYHGAATVPATRPRTGPRSPMPWAPPWPARGRCWPSAGGWNRRAGGRRAA
ncbi:phosphatase PAP2 family protein [Catenulispora yoronensis]